MTFMKNAQLTSRARLKMSSSCASTCSCVSAGNVGLYGSAAVGDVGGVGGSFVAGSGPAGGA
jgi:hypothetical protein